MAALANIYIPEEEAATLRALKGIELVRGNPDQLPPSTAIRVTEDQANQWLTALEKGGWHGFDEIGIPDSVRREAIEAYLLQNSANDVNLHDLPAELLPLAARLVTAQPESQRNDYAASRDNSPVAAANDIDRKDAKANDASATDNDDDNTVTALTATEETLLAFDVASGEATGSPLLGTARTKTADATDTAETSDAASEQPRGFKETVKGAFKTFSNFINHPVVQLGFHVALPHAASILANTAAFHDAAKIVGQIVEPVLSGKALSRPALKIERQPD